MINETDLQYSLSENSQEINLGNIFKKLKRNTIFILSTTTLSAIFSIYYSSIQAPIFKGQFQILVRDEEASNNSISSNINIPVKGIIANNSFKETQALILTSPKVLNPIYEFAKTEYQKREDNISTLTYNKWFRNNINFEFIKGSDVFEITFKDRDKKFILLTLNMISEQYKKYSKEEQNKNLNRELDYLNMQEKIYRVKYEESFKKNNEFIIDNNLYNKDNQSLQFNPGDLSFKNPLQKTNKIRYSEQFSLLDEYELKFTKYSSILKPNSEYLKDLNFQISKLKKIIQKPTRILLQKEFLNKALIRDEVTLENIKNQIIVTKLALAKQKDPWELISTPTVDEQKISPNRKSIFFTFFFLSFFISSFLAFLKEIFIGSIDDIDIIKSILKANFVNVISLSFNEMNAKVLESNFENIFSEKNNKESKNIGIYYQNDSQLISDYIDKNKKLSYVADFNKINDISNILIFLESGKVTYDQIYRINKYVEIYQEKKFYWFYVEDKKNV
tara:strand:- start:11795 stop:13306 length:1512 start_codon:yes stop_codon:yes gene_type:complete